MLKLKKAMSLLIVCLLSFGLISCEGEIEETVPAETEIAKSTYEIDYYSAEEFEGALNNGVSVQGKIVQFYVNAYKPDSVLGINCHAGEHLNFISEEELDVVAGNYIIGRVTEEPWKILGSWDVSYEVLEISDKAIEKPEASDKNSVASIPTETTQPSATTIDVPETTTTTEPTAPPKPTKISMVSDSKSYMGNKPQDVEKELKELGFANIKLTEKKTTDTIIVDGVVASVTVANKDFKKGDAFEKDVSIVITYWKVEKTETPAEPNNGVSYSTNSKTTVKNGNTGVYSYKSIGGIYDIYWIIDFDEGYVYWFTDGNGDGQCDRLKIQSGNLNSVLIITYHDGGTVWSNGLHFKYKNQPDHLIMQDHNGFEYDYYPTNLKNALSIRKEKTIVDY